MPHDTEKRWESLPFLKFLKSGSGVKIAVAIVLGILFVFEFPQKWFRWAERGTAAGN